MIYKMNTIIETQEVPSTKNNKKKFFAISAVLALLVTVTIYARSFVLADNQPTSDEQLTTINAQINEIEKNIMVRSHEYNENQKIIDEKTTRNTELNNQNNEARQKKSELEDQKAKLIS